MKENIWSFIGSFDSLELASVDNASKPHISYAPFITNQNRFYICTSGMAKHTSYLSENRVASIMFIEDEAKCENIFARKRVTFDVEVSTIARNSMEFEGAMSLFEQKFGENAQIYRALADFILFELKPVSGRAVFGFGAAVDLKEIL